MGLILIFEQDENYPISIKTAEKYLTGEETIETFAN